MGRHVAVVVDEYGSTAGIITLADLLRALVGEVEEKGEAGRVHLRPSEAQPRRVRAGGWVDAPPRSSRECSASRSRTPLGRRSRRSAETDHDEARPAAVRVREIRVAGRACAWESGLDLVPAGQSWGRFCRGSFQGLQPGDGAVGAGAGLGRACQWWTSVYFCSRSTVRGLGQAGRQRRPMAPAAMPSWPPSRSLRAAPKLGGDRAGPRWPSPSLSTPRSAGRRRGPVRAADRAKCNRRWIVRSRPARLRRPVRSTPWPMPWEWRLPLRREIEESDRPPALSQGAG
jgi:hypothetical protein